MCPARDEGVAGRLREQLPAAECIGGLAKGNEKKALLIARVLIAASTWKASLNPRKRGGHLGHTTRV